MSKMSKPNKLFIVFMLAAVLFVSACSPSSSKPKQPTSQPATLGLISRQVQQVETQMSAIQSGQLASDKDVKANIASIQTNIAAIQSDISYIKKQLQVLQMSTQSPAPTATVTPTASPTKAAK